MSTAIKKRDLRRLLDKRASFKDLTYILATVATHEEVVTFILSYDSGIITEGLKRHGWDFDAQDDLNIYY